jgi:hypothetical protein
MKMLMLVYSGPTPQRVTQLLDRHGVAGYSELGNVHGAGATGRRAGTRAWPGDSSLFVTIVPAAQANDLVAALRQEAQSLPAPERLHAAVLPIETFF